MPSPRRRLATLAARGFFVAPTLIEIGSVADLGREVFGPVLHVLRFKRDRLSALIEALNATGYALTGGVHSRVDTTIELVARRIGAGNVYVNRNIIGAVVGVQPFGGHGLSGTGPKAGGPLYLKRLLASAPRRLAFTPGRGAERGGEGVRGVRRPARRRGARDAVRADRRARANSASASSCPVRSASAMSIRSNRAAPCCATRRTRRR